MINITSDLFDKIIVGQNETAMSGVTISILALKKKKKFG